MRPGWIEITVEEVIKKLKCDGPIDPDRLVPFMARKMNRTETEIRDVLSGMIHEKLLFYTENDELSAREKDKAIDTVGKLSINAPETFEIMKEMKLFGHRLEKLIGFLAKRYRFKKKDVLEWLNTRDPRCDNGRSPLEVIWEKGDKGIDRVKDYLTSVNFGDYA